MGKKYKWGIMGAGNISRKLAGALAISGKGELAFVASKSTEQAESFAKEFGVDAWGSYEQLLARDDIDVAYVATTHNFHHALARMALEAGKNVLIEKPFTVNEREVADLIDLARSKGLFMMEAMWTRFLPATIALHNLVAEGRIGTLRFMDITFGNFALPMYEGRLKDPALAGGVTLDMGIYPLSFVSHMTDSIPTDIHSLCTLTNLGVDEFAAYQLRFPCGALAHIATSFTLKMENRAVLYGSKGYVEFPNFPSGAAFTQRTHDGGNQVLSSQDFSFDHGENGFTFQIEEVHRCLDARLIESPTMPLDESRSLMAVMDTMRREWGLTYACEKP